MWIEYEYKYPYSDFDFCYEDYYQKIDISEKQIHRIP
jgi:hypothetical protein